MADMLRTIDITSETESEEDIKFEIDTVFQAVSWALRTTVSTVTKTSPGQIIFGRDMIFDFSVRANWEAIEKRRLKIAERNNARENSRRRPHTYHIGSKILLVNDGDKKRKIGDPTFLGPYEITRINKNGTVKINRGRYSETINIRRVKPFYEGN